MKQKANSLFKIWWWLKNKSIKTANIPIVNGWKKILWVVDIIKDDILLLISAMSKLVQCKNCGRNRSYKVNGQVIKLQCNSSGHYCVPLTTLTRENCNVAFHLISLFLLSNNEKKEQIRKTASSVILFIKRLIMMAKGFLMAKVFEGDSRMKWKL